MRVTVDETKIETPDGVAKAATITTEDGAMYEYVAEVRRVE